MIYRKIFLIFIALSFQDVVAQTKRATKIEIDAHSASRAMLESYKFEIIKNELGDFRLILKEIKYYPRGMQDNWMTLVELDKEFKNSLNKGIDETKRFIYKLKSIDNKLSNYYALRAVKKDTLMNFQGDSTIIDIEKETMLKIEESIFTFNSYSDDRTILKSLGIDQAWLEKNMFRIKEHISSIKRDTVKYDKYLKCLNDIHNYEVGARVNSNLIKSGLGYMQVKLTIQFSDSTFTEIKSQGNTSFLIPWETENERSYNANISLLLSSILPNNFFGNILAGQFQGKKYDAWLMDWIIKTCE